MNGPNELPKAIVLLSGGMDSATCLAIAQADGYTCIALSFDYGQRSQSELEAAAKLADHLQVSHQVIRLDPASMQGSALTDASIDVPETPGDGIPTTYVPARNTVFLAYALGVAEVADADAVFIGANVIDYSGYPDCRPEFLEAFQRVMTLGTKRGVEGRPIELKTPLIELSKAQIIEKAVSLGLDLANTISCYQTDSQGRACGRCDSCQLRKEGFDAAGIADPTVYQI